MCDKREFGGVMGMEGFRVFLGGWKPGEGMGRGR